MPDTSTGCGCRSISRMASATECERSLNHATPNTVTATDKAFDSKALDTSDRYEHTFSSEGDYAYYCTVHPFMTGVVHVRKQ